MTDYEFDKYCTDTENLKDTIEKYGVAIIPNVLDEKECKNMVCGMWKYFEHITQSWEVPIKRKDTESWNQFYKLYPLHSMLIQRWGSGHAQVSWDLRQNEKIVDIFANFWKCQKEDLLVSFDGMSFNLPPEVTRRGWYKKPGWFHTDQSFTRNEFESLDSWITGVDVNEGDATLCIMEGSHKLHKAFADEYKITTKDDWNKLTEEQEQFYVERGCSYKYIKCPKGSLVLWDPRTIHCGVEASPSRSKMNIRAIVYLCYMPRRMCTPANLKKKQKAFNDLRNTNHYPCKPKLFPVSPYTYGGDIPKITPIEKPVLTELGRKLAGF